MNNYPTKAEVLSVISSIVCFFILAAFLILTIIRPDYMASIGICLLALYYSYVYCKELSRHETKSNKHKLRSFRIAFIILMFTMLSTVSFIFNVFLPLENQKFDINRTTVRTEATLKMIADKSIFDFNYFTEVQHFDGPHQERISLELLNQYGVCEKEFLSNGTENMCSALKEYKIAMTLVDKYEYKPECLTYLAEGNYEDFNECSEVSTPYVNPLEKFIKK